MSEPSAFDWEEAENAAGAHFRYRRETDRRRVVERIAFTLVEQRQRVQWLAERASRPAVRIQVEGNIEQAAEALAKLKIKGDDW